MAIDFRRALFIRMDFPQWLFQQFAPDYAIKSTEAALD
jgi:hypothetical protein